MGTRIYKIARNGMAGRKKDTLLLMIVIIMSFFFTVLAIALQGSFQKTSDAQRLRLYGSWHAAYLDADDNILEHLKQQQQITSIGKSYLFETNSSVGIVGTYNQALLDMGEFNLTEGKFPQKPGDIVLETSKVAELGLKKPVGQKINVVYEYVLQETSQEEINEYTAKIIKDHDEKLKQQGEVTAKPKENNQSMPNWYRAYDPNQIMDYEHRTVDWEQLDNATLTLGNLYYINYYGGEIPGPEQIREQGILKQSILRVNMSFTICGVISDYSERWDVSYYPLANAFITEEAGRELEDIVKNTKLTDTADCQETGKLNLFLTSDTLGENLYNELAPKLLTEAEIEKATGNTGYGEASGAITINNIKLRKNNFAYPVMEGSTEATLLILILTIIFIATIVSVFQIFLSQVKRRSRKIALLKSIGATNGQIISMLIWEGAYLLLTCLLTGVLSGVGIAYMVLQIMGIFKGAAVIFYVDLQLAGFGLLAGIFAVILGMLVPAVYAAGTPLVGAMSKPPKHNIQRYKKKLLVNKNNTAKLQSFRSISLRHISLNKGKTVLNLIISAITISILTSAVFVCYLAFADYNKTVAIPGRPDYTLEIPYGVDDIYAIHYSNAINKIYGIKDVDGYRRGDNLHMIYENIARDEIIADFYRLIPEGMAAEHFAPGYGDGKAVGEKYGDVLIDNALLTNMYGIDIDSEIGKTIINSITEGKLDKEAFSQGEEVILVLPMNKKGTADSSSLKSFNDITLLSKESKYSRMKWLLQKEDAYTLSLSKRYRDIYDKNEYIKVGDMVVISANEEIQNGDNIITKYEPYGVKVAGIISYFPKRNIWPFSETCESYAVIASSKLFTKTYKASDNGLMRRDYGNNSFYTHMIQTLFETKFGKTIFQIYADKRADRVKTDTQMIEYANSLNAKLYNYRESNQVLYKGALNNALIIGLLGFATAAVAIFILFNILTSTARQEQQRIGILQSIGVTNKQLTRLQITTGFVFSLIALVVAHIILTFVMFLTSFGNAGDVALTGLEYIKDVFGRMELYPWEIHGLICICFIGLTVLVYYAAAKEVIKRSPVENMRV
jgi:ABC-type lipoprotein release transport system permease subunit